MQPIPRLALLAIMLVAGPCVGTPLAAAEPGEERTFTVPARGEAEPDAADSGDRVEPRRRHQSGLDI